MNKALRPKKIPVGGDLGQPAEAEEELSGTLRAVDLEKDYLDLVVHGEVFHVVGLGDAMDDVIGPMVNKLVKVRVQRRGKRGKLHLNDIELDQ